MTYRATLPLAAILFLGLGVAAHAAPAAAETARAMPTWGWVLTDETPVHRCHGQSAGTAHRSCGTATGGPVGGLF